MKQDIENIIKKNLPENRKHIHGKECKDYDECDKFSWFERAFENALSQIPVSLIADEVLKVVVEKIREMKLKYELSQNNKIFNLSVDEIIKELSNLSPNKENKSNENSNSI